MYLSAFVHQNIPHLLLYEELSTPGVEYAVTVMDRGLGGNFGVFDLNNPQSLQVRKTEDLGLLQATLFYGIASAVHYLHRKGIVHRDVSAKNAVLKPPLQDCLNDPRLCEAMLIDYDLSCYADTSDCYDYPHIRGTRPYVSPELFQQAHAMANYSDDMWALGVLLHEILHGNLPTLDWMSTAHSLSKSRMTWLARCSGLAYTNPELSSDCLVATTDHFGALEAFKAYRYSSRPDGATEGCCDNSSASFRLLSGLLVPSDLRFTSGEVQRIAAEWQQQEANKSSRWMAINLDYSRVEDFWLNHSPMYSHLWT